MHTKFFLNLNEQIISHIYPKHIWVGIIFRIEQNLSKSEVTDSLTKNTYYSYNLYYLMNFLQNMFCVNLKCLFLLFVECFWNKCCSIKVLYDSIYVRRKYQLFSPGFRYFPKSSKKKFWVLKTKKGHQISENPFF